MTAELRARLARVEEDLKKTRDEVETLKRFKIVVTTLWAATLGLAGVFGEKLKKALGL
ncbi:hypothetical protein [Caulobacter sp. UC70_42]|uniref:hypothetical protein n=1 Tax=Caulobacter sp. UC70_42 TaxID=3374551 RepID=UPI003756E03E